MPKSWDDVLRLEDPVCTLQAGAGLCVNFCCNSRNLSSSRVEGLTECIDSVHGIRIIMLNALDND